MKLGDLKHKWPKKLNDTKDVIKYVMKWSPIDEDEDNLLNYFANTHGELKEVDLSWVKRNPDRELRDDPHLYADLDPSTSPPLLVDERGVIEDGQHRYESAKKRGDKKILVYVLSPK